MVQFQIHILILLLLLQFCAGNLDDCWKSDRKSCKIDGAFKTANSNYIFEVTIDCNTDRFIPKRYNKRFDNIENFMLNGCQSDKSVNPFEEIIDPQSVQHLTIQKFYIPNLNSLFVKTAKNLKTFEMKHNEVLLISEDIFIVFQNLEELSFVENISPSFDFTSLQTLQNLKKLTIIQPTWTIQFDHLLRIPSIGSLQLTVDAVNSGLTTSEDDYYVGSLEEIIITNTLLNVEFVQSELKGMLSNVRTMILKNNRMTMFPFSHFDLTELEILDLSGNQMEFIDLNKFTTNSPKLQIFNISHNEIEHLSIDMKDQNINSLQIFDISHNKLQNIQFVNYGNNVLSPNFQMIVNSNPWSCMFLITRQYLKIFKMFKYEKDLSQINVNGLNCIQGALIALELVQPFDNSADPTKETTQIVSSTETSIDTSSPDSNTNGKNTKNEGNTFSTTEIIVHKDDGNFRFYDMDLDNTEESWTTTTTIPINIESTTEDSKETISTKSSIIRDAFSEVIRLIVLTMLFLMIVILCAFTFTLFLYFTKPKYCKKKWEFYSLIQPNLHNKNYELVCDISTRKLPSIGYETPLKYVDPEEPNDVIYEEIIDPYEYITVNIKNESSGQQRN